MSNPLTEIEKKQVRRACQIVGTAIYKTFQLADGHRPTEPVAQLAPVWDRVANELIQWIEEAS